MPTLEQLYPNTFQAKSPPLESLYPQSFKKDTKPLPTTASLESLYPKVFQVQEEPVTTQPRLESLYPESFKETKPFLSGEREKSLPVRALETIGDLALQVGYRVPQGIVEGSLALQDWLGMGLEKAFGMDVSKQRAGTAEARRLMEKHAPVAEGGLAQAAGGVAKFVGAAAGPGGLARVGAQTGLKALGKVGEKELFKRAVRAPQAGATFAGGTAVLDTDALVSGELTIEEFFANMGYSGLTGFLLGGVGGLPAKTLTGKAARLGGEYGALVGTEPVVRHGRLPNKDELLYGGILLGAFKGVQAGMQRLGEKRGQPVEQVRADERQKFEQTGKLSPELQAEVKQKGATDAERNRIRQEAQKAEAEEIVPPKPAPVEPIVSSPREKATGVGKVVEPTEAEYQAQLEAARGTENIFDLMREKGIENIRITDFLKQLVHKDNYKTLRQKKIGLFVKKETAPAIDEAADAMGMTPQVLVDNILSTVRRELRPEFGGTVGGKEYLLAAQRASEALRRGDMKTYTAEMDKLSPQEQIGVHISTEIPEAAKPGIRERFDTAYTAIKDQFRPIQHLTKDVSGDKPLPIGKDPYLLYRLTVGWRGKPETFLERGTFTLKEGATKFTGRGLKQILEPIGNRMDAYRKYLLAKHIPETERVDKTAGVRPDLDVAQRIELANQAVKNLEAEHPDFAKIQAEHQQWKQTSLKYLRDSGVISAETEQLWNKMYKNYVPMYRAMDTPGIEGVGKGHGEAFQPIKRREGSERQIIDPVESDIKNTYAIFAAAERNVAAKAVADLAGRPGAEKWIKKVAAPMRPVAQVDAREMAKKIANDLGVSFEEIGATPEKLVTVFRPDTFVPKGRNIIQIFRNGKREMYEVEPTLYKAMTALDTQSMGMVMRMLSFPAKVLRAGATLTPEFSLARNPLRDMVTAFVYSKYGFIPVIDTARGLFHFLGATDTYFRWKASGGEHSMLVSLDRNYLQHNLQTLIGGRSGQIKTLFKHPMEALRALSEATETATRLGEFRLAETKEGITPGGLKRGAFASREVTLDFGRIGTTGRGLNSIIAFFNANVEGLDKMRRTFQENPTKATVAAMAGITLPSVLLWFANRDDEEIQNLPTWRKDLFWNFRIGDKIAALPKPFELGIIFGTVPEKILDWTLKNDPKSIERAAEAVLRAGTPGIIPTAALPLLEYKANRSFFLDRPIIPRGKEDLEPYLQSKGYTSEMSKLIGKHLNVSPAVIDHFVYGHLAGLGRLAVSGVDVGLERAGLTEGIPKPEGTWSDVPILRAFVARNPSTQSESMENFYEERKRANTVSKTIKRLLKDGKFEEAKKYSKKNREVIKNHKYLESVASQLGKYRKVMDRVRQSRTLTPQQKRQKLDRVMTDMTNLTYRTMQRLRKRDTESKLQTSQRETLGEPVGIR